MATKSIVVLTGRARLYPPKEPGGTWRITYKDKMNKRRTTHGGKTQDEATAHAARKLGDWTPEDVSGQPIPTLQEAFDTFIGENTSRWNPRTVEQYNTMGKRFLKKLGHMQVSQLSTRDFATVDISNLSRGQQTKVRSLIRGTMKVASNFVHAAPDSYADAVRLTGTRLEARDEEVRRGDVAPSSFIYDVINACYSTCQLHPVRRYMNDVEGLEPPAFNEITGEHGHDEQWFTQADGRWDTLRFDEGMPVQWVKDHHRRGMPKHYKNIEKRQKDETKELAARYRMFSLAVGLSAGIGLRIGEVLPLRVRDFVENNYERMEHLFVNARSDNPDRQLMEWNYIGRLEINKQSSEAGRIILSLPKHEKVRTVWIPAILYHRSETAKMLNMDRRRQAVDAGLTHFTNEDISLWRMTREDSLVLWQNNIIPLAWMLLDRLNDLWDQLHKNTKDDNWRFEDFQKLLLFPTRTPPRRNNNIMVPPRWHEDASIVPGFGGYVSTTNFANQLTNPIFDFVSKKTRSYPEHRRNLPEGKRKGWTFHALRHYFITSTIYHRVALPSISEMAGHATVDFTMKRYSHAIRKSYDLRGFE